MGTQGGHGMRDRIAKDILGIPKDKMRIITPDVVELRKSLDVPGMAVLQFAFGGDATNPYLPHNIDENSVVYTGTHDNDTTAGWLEALDERAATHLRRYTGTTAERRIDVRDIVRMAQASVARTAIVPFQDVLGLGSEARMNLPGTSVNNWRWRFTTGQLTPALVDRLGELTALYGRAAPR